MTSFNTDYLAVGATATANVETQANYLADLQQTPPVGSLANGYLPGLVRSPQFNKTIRQSTVVAAAIGKFIANALAINTVDDGNLGTLTTNLINAITLTVAGSSPLTPVGTVIDFAGLNIPSGWLEANGQAVSRLTYANLFVALGTVYGAGDGSTTFNLPNYNGRIGIGRNGSFAPNLGSVGGEYTHQLTIGEMPVHNHVVNDPSHAHSVNDPTHAHSVSDNGHVHSYNSQGPANFQQGGGGSAPMASGPGNQGTSANATGISIQGAGTGINIRAVTTGVTLQNSGGNLAHNNVQPSAVLLKLIKY